MGKYRRVERLHGLDDTVRQQREKSVQVFYEPDGTMVLQARLPAEQGALLLKALEMALDADTEQTDKNVSAETPQTESDDEAAAKASTGIWRLLPCVTNS